MNAGSGILVVALDEAYFDRVAELAEGRKVTVLTTPNLLGAAADVADYVLEADFIDHDVGNAVARQFTEGFYEVYGDRSEFRRAIEPHINSLVYYVVWPLFALQAQLRRLAESGRYQHCYILGGHRAASYIAPYGSGSREDPFSVLFRRAWMFTPFLYEAFDSDPRFTFIEDPHWRIRATVALRRLVIHGGVFAATLARHVRGSVRRFFSPEPRRSTGRGKALVFPVRTVHQLRVIRGLVGELTDRGINPVVVDYGGLTGEGPQSDLRRYPPAGARRSLYRFQHIRQIFAAAADTLRWRIRNCVTAGPRLSIEHRGTALSFPAGELVSELYLFPFFQAYTGMLSAELTSFSTERGVAAVVSSEQIDKHAFHERLAADRLGLRFVNMQTGLFNVVPYPVVAVGDLFFLGTASNYEAYSGLGWRNKGEVAYVGPLKYVGHVRPASDSASGDLRGGTIVYITQPGETPVDRTIVDALIEWCRPHGCAVQIKLHPRVARSQYQDYGAMDGVSVLRDEVDLYDLVEAADMVVGRTSSVLQESLVLGTPCIACLLTEADRVLDTDFLGADSPLACLELDELTARCARFPDYADAFHRYRRAYLEKEGLDDIEGIVDRFLDAVLGDGWVAGRGSERG